MINSVATTMETTSNCQEIDCLLDGCTGNHQKPWFMTQKPVHDPKCNVADPVVLMKQDGWVLEKATESHTESNIGHYCPSLQWKKHLTIPEIRGGWCLECHEDIPIDIVGAFTMHNWKSLQQYDRDMKQYGAYDAAIELDTDIKVYR